MKHKLPIKKVSRETNIGFFLCLLKNLYFKSYFIFLPIKDRNIFCPL